MKGTAALILVIVLGVSLRYYGVLPINSLLMAGNSHHVPYSNLGIRSIDKATSDKLRLETPTITRNLIVQSVGEQYFSDHFTDPQVELLNYTDGDWFAHTYYTYSYAIGNYSQQQQAGAWFNERGELIYTEGIPHSDNLMPFKVTEETARAVARYVIRFQGLPGGYTHSDAYLVDVSGYPIIPRVERYSWVVVFYRTLGADPNGIGAYGESVTVVIDANTQWVYAAWTGRWEWVS